MAKLEDDYEYMGPLDNAGGQGDYEYVGPLSGGAMDYVTEPVKRTVQGLTALPRAAMEMGEKAVDQWGQDRQSVLTSPPNPLKYFPAVGQFLKQSAPEIVGGTVGGVLGGFPGAAGGAGAVRALYEWLTGTPAKEAIIQGETSALGGFAAPRVPFKGKFLKADPVKAAAYEGAGVQPSLGDLTGSRLAQSAESISGRSLLGAGGTQKFQQGQLGEAGQRFKDIVGEIGGVRERFPLGEETAQAVEGRLQKKKGIYGEAKKRLRDQYGDVEVPRENVAKTIQSLLNGIDEAEPAVREKLAGTRTFLQRLLYRESPESITVPSQRLGVAGETAVGRPTSMGVGPEETVQLPKTKVVQGRESGPIIAPQSPLLPPEPTTPGTQPLRQWESTNTFLGSVGRSDALTPDLEKGRMQALFKASMQDLEGAPGLEGQAAAKLLKRLKEFYKSEVVAAEDTLPGKLAKGQMHNELVGSMFSKEGLTPLMELKKWAPGKFHEVRNRGFIDYLERSGAIDWERGTFDPGKFKDRWYAIKDDVKAYAFEPGTVKKLDQLAVVGEDLQRKGIGAGRSQGTGSNLPLWQMMQALMLGGSGGIAAYSQNPLAALPGLAFLLGPAGAGKAVRSPSFIRAMTTPYTTPQKIARTSGFAALTRQGEGND